jgi:hypothetical protein
MGLRDQVVQARQQRGGGVAGAQQGKVGCRLLVAQHQQVDPLGRHPPTVPAGLRDQFGELIPQRRPFGGPRSLRGGRYHLDER